MKSTLRFFIILLLTFSTALKADVQLSLDGSDDEATPERSASVIENTPTQEQLNKTIDQLSCSENLEGGVKTKTCLNPDAVKDKSKISKINVAKLLAGSAVVAGFYTAAGVWSGYAWYNKDNFKKKLFTVDEGWFGAETYAGGSDKLGHGFGNYVITRANAAILMGAGVSRPVASAVSATLTLMFYTGIELTDGHIPEYGFSWGDMTANTLGNLLAVVMINFPKIDEMFDIRLEYVPSKIYRKNLVKNSDVDFAEDYSGMHYGIWYHLASLPQIKNSTNPYFHFLRFFDAGIGWHTKNYLPYNEKDLFQRELSVGLSLNVPLSLNYILNKDHKGKKTTLRNIRDGIFELFTLPWTTTRVNVDLNRNVNPSIDYPGKPYP